MDKEQAKVIRKEVGQFFQNEKNMVHIDVEGLKQYLQKDFELESLQPVAKGCAIFNRVCALKGIPQPLKDPRGYMPLYNSAYDKILETYQKTYEKAFDRQTSGNADPRVSGTMFSIDGFLQKVEKNVKHYIHEAKNELCKMDNGLSTDMSVAKLKHIRTNPEIESLAQVAAVSSLKVNSYYARRRKHAFARNDRREDRFDIQFIALKQGHLLDLGQVLLAADKDYVITPKDFKAERLEEARKNLTAMELMELSMGTSLEEIVARKTGQAFQAEKEVDSSVTAVELPLEVSHSSQEPAREPERVSEGKSIPIEERSVEEPKTSLKGGSLDDLVAALQSEPVHVPKERHIVAKLEVDDTLAARRQQIERAELQEQAFSMMVKEMSQESSENDWLLEQ